MAIANHKQRGLVHESTLNQEAPAHPVSMLCCRTDLAHFTTSQHQAAVPLVAMAAVSPADFEQLQAQLLQLRTDLYEAKEKEARAVKALAKAQTAPAAGTTVPAGGTNGSSSNGVSSSAASSSFQTISEDGTTHLDPPPPSSASASPSIHDTPGASAGGGGGTAASSAKAGLTSLMASVKRNSASIGAAISNAAHSAASSTNSSDKTHSLSATERLEQELADLRAQSANDLDEAREQSVALKMSVQMLHKKAQELERQNSTLMTHLSNLEEERQSLAEKREKELRRRQAKAEGRMDSNEQEDEEDDAEEDVDKLKEKWRARRLDMETKLKESQTQLATAKETIKLRDVALAKLEVTVSDDSKNFARLLAKMQEKDEELMKAREEAHVKTQQLKQIQAAAVNVRLPAEGAQSTGAGANASNAGVLTSPKTVSTLRGLMNKITAPEKDATASAAAALPSTSPEVSGASPSATTAATVPLPSPSASPSIPAPSTSPSITTTATAASASSSQPPQEPLSPASPEPVDPWSASQPLDQQVVSLLAEVSRLQVMSSHLLSSVQRKDSTIRAISDDCERVMEKLAEKEMHVMAAREQAADAQEKLRRKEQQLAKVEKQLQQATGGGGAQGNGGAGGSGTSGTGGSASSFLNDDPSSSSTASAELRAATASISLLQSDFDSLKETLENTKDLLFLAETQLIDKQKLVGEREEALKEVRAQTEVLERSLQSLLTAKSTSEGELNEHIDYLEKKLLGEVGEWERRYDEEKAAWEEEKGRAGEERKRLMKELKDAQEEENELRRQLDSLTNDHTALKASSEETTSALAALQVQYTELLSNGAIETRKRNHLVLELKSTLKSELIRSKELLARLKNAEDDIVTLRVMNQHQIAASTTSTGEGQINGANGGTGQQQGMDGQHPPATPSSSSASNNGGNAGSHNTSLHPPQPPTPSSSTHSKGVEQEVTVALAQKLAELQNDKHSLSKKVRSLEEHVDLLENDVGQKKEMIRNLVRRIETGALATSSQLDDDSHQKTALFSSLGPEAKQALFEKMEIILQDTTLQNAQYRANLQSMGGEVTKLMSELDTLRTEAAEAKEEVDLTKDELELAQQSASDSAALVKNTEARAAKLERTLYAVLVQLQQAGTLDATLDQLDADAQTQARAILASPPRRPSLTGRSAPSTPAQAQRPSAATATPVVAITLPDMPPAASAAAASSPPKADTAASQRAAAVEARAKESKQKAKQAAAAAAAAASAEASEDTTHNLP